jgi:hypothetical protein
MRNEMAASEQNGKTHVENQATGFIKSVVGSSDPQTEGLGKLG